MTSPWYQRQPYPLMVKVLLDAELLAEGGTDSLRLASRLALAARTAVPGREVEAVAERLATEHNDGQLTAEHIVQTRFLEVAQDLVDALTAHERHRPREGDTRA